MVGFQIKVKKISVVIIKPFKRQSHISIVNSFGNTSVFCDAFHLLIGGVKIVM